MGHPVAHSRSPMIHGYWLKALGIAGAYEFKDLAPDELLPADTRLWALLQNASGGVWGGCIYDVEAVARAIGG